MRLGDAIGGPTRQTAFAVRQGGNIPRLRAAGRGSKFPRPASDRESRRVVGKTGIKTASAVAQPVCPSKSARKRRHCHVVDSAGTGSGARRGDMEMTTDEMDIESALLAAWPTRSEKNDSRCGSDRARGSIGTAVLTIGSPNQFFLDRIRPKLRTVVEDACLAILGRCPALEFRVEITGQSGGAADAWPAACRAPVDCQPTAQSGSERWFRQR